MKTYKVHLKIGGISFIEADRWEQLGDFYKFFRDESVTAEFPIPWVLKIEEKQKRDDGKKAQDSR